MNNFGDETCGQIDMVFSLYVHFKLSVHRIFNENGKINKTFQREIILSVCPKKILEFDQMLGPKLYI
jgi:hypothetical protein